MNRQGLAVVVVMTALVTGACSAKPPARPGDDSLSGNTSAPSATPQTPEEEAGTSGAEALVEDPEARLTSFAVAVEDPQLRASVWTLRSCDNCTDPAYALVTTTDGFRTRTIADVSPARFLSVTALGTHSLAIRQDSRLRWILTGDGQLSPVEPPTKPSPVTAAEVVVRDGLRFVALNPGTGTTHRLLLPRRERADSGKRRRVTFVEVTRQGRWLTAIARTPRRPWLERSSDGGLHWTRLRLPGERFGVFDPMPSAVPGVPTFFESADGATLVPFVGSHRLASTTWKSAPGPQDPTAYLSGWGVLPSGAMLAVATNWSDDRAGKFTTSPGFYQSEVDDWSRWHRVPQGAPFAAVQRFQPEVLQLTATPGRLRVTVVGPDSHTAGPPRARDAPGASWPRGDDQDHRAVQECPSSNNRSRSRGRLTPTTLW